MSRRTKDESFLIKLYEEANEEGDFSVELNFQEIGKKMVLKERVIKTIIRDLAQANFVQKIDHDTIKLTQNGINLAQKFKEGWTS